MRAREVVLALLLIGAGIFITQAQTGRLDDWLFGWDGPRFGRFEEFAFEETRLIEGAPPAELLIQNSHGDIEVAGEEIETVSIVFRKRISARDKVEAESLAAGLRMVVETSDARLVLKTNREEFSRKRFRTDFRIIVPSGTNVVLKNAYGLVRAERTGRTEITALHARVAVLEIAGPLSIESRYEDVDVDTAHGDVRLDGSHADAVIRNVEGALSVKHAYGDLRLEAIGKKLIIDGTHSRIFAKNLRGEAEIATSYEPVDVASARAVRIRTHQSDVSVSGADGFVHVTNEYGRVRINDLRGDLNVEGRNVEVAGRTIRASVINLRTSYRDVDLSDFTGRTTINLDHGSLLLAPDNLDHPIAAEGTYADIRLVWPAGIPAPFEGRARSGRIFWNLDAPPSLETTNGTSVLKAFPDAAGTPGVKIFTSYGDIRIDSAPRRPF